MSGWLSKLLGRSPEFTRPPRFAGILYPSEAGELEEAIGQALEAASPRAQAHGRLKALIVPMAELDYIARVSAPAYAALGDAAKDLRHVAVLGASSRVPFHGLGLSAQESFACPLGHTLIDREFVYGQLIEGRDDELVRYIDAAHDPEPSIECQLPWLRVAAQRADLVPVLLGDGAPGPLAERLRDLVAREDTVLVAVGNLSEGFSDEEAWDLDASTLEAITSLEAGAIQRQHASSRSVLRVVIHLAEALGWRVEVLARSSSARSGQGPSEAVQGYASLALWA